MIYDFDYTLISGNMQDNTLSSVFGLTPDEFWNSADEFKNMTKMEHILVAMYFPVLLAKEQGIKISKELLRDCGRKINTFYKGVETWFDRIKEYGKSIGLDVKHYILSSGLQDMVEASKIGDKIDKVFGCAYFYNDDGEAVWPQYCINYTQKTQYIARIRKGLIDNLSDDSGINDKINKDSCVVPYTHMIYIGDGDTDVPCMKMIKDHGGHSMCIYEEEREKKYNIAAKLVSDGRVDCAVLADYTEGSALDIKVKEILKNISDVD